METQELITKDFEGNEISFDIISGDMLINATEMGKFYNRKPYDFLRQKQTQNFISELKKSKSFIEYVHFNYGKSTAIKKEFSDEELDEFIVQTRRGQFHSGTFMYRKLALKFAAWLDPKFELWIFDTIEELIFGSSPHKVQEALINVPILYKEKLNLSKEVTKLKKSIIDESVPASLKILRNDLTNINDKIKSLVIESSQLNLFDGSEDVGNRLITLSKEKSRIEAEISKLDKEERRILNKEEYINLNTELSKKKSKLSEYLNNIRKN